MLLSKLKESLSEPRNDGYLHFSQHLQHDRHAAIYMKYGYPKTTPAWGRMFPLVQGTGIHDVIHTHMAKIVDQYLPEHPIVLDDEYHYPWTGTVDAFAKVGDEYWILDYKTISGAGMFFLGDEPKEDHKWQVSAYHAFMPMTSDDWRTAVIYLPSSPDYKKNWSEPVMLEFEPYSKREVEERISDVERAIGLYLEDNILPDIPPPTFAWKKRGKTYFLQQRPHYTTLFCPWSSLIDDPCGCSDEKSSLLATYTEGDLKIEDGYDKMVKQIIQEIGYPYDS